MFPPTESDHVQDGAIFQERASSLSHLISPASIDSMLMENCKEALVQLRSVEPSEIDHLSIGERIQHYNRLGFVLEAMSDHEAANVNYRKSIEVAESAGEVWGMLEGYIDASGVKISLGDLDAAEKYINMTGLLLESFNKIRYRAYWRCREGYLNSAYYNFGKAQENFLEAKRLISAIEDLRLKDHYYHVMIHSGLGTLHERNGSYGLASKAFGKAVEIAKKNNLNVSFPIAALNLAKTLIQNEDVESAESILNEGLEFEGYMDESIRAGMLAQLGYCRFKNGAYKAASRLFENAKTSFNQALGNYHPDLFSIERWMAALHMETNDFDQAGRHYKSAFKLAEKIKGFKALSAVYKDISNYYEKISDYKAAYAYAMLHNAAIENYYEELSDQKRYELEIKYETEQKEKEAEFFELQAAKLQLKALRAQMNPHFIYNALNAIQHFISSNRDKDAAAYLAKFAILMRKSLDYSDKDFISLEEEIEFIKDYLEINQKLRFENNMTYKIEVDAELEEDITGIPSMIVQPYVENAIEHGIRMKEKGHIDIRFHLLDHEHIMCVIEDNGIGRKAAQEYQAKKEDLKIFESKGTRITQERLQLINKTSQRNLYVKTIDLFDPKGKAAGTRVEIRIPNIDI